jgi:hypothetical protein
MPHYLSQVSYTPEAWARLVANPQDRIEAVAIAIAFAAGGSVKSEKTTPLMTTAEALEAIKKAGTTGYRSLTAGASAAAARS